MKGKIEMTLEEVLEIIEESDMGMVEAFEFVEDETDLDPAEVISKIF